MQSQTPETDGSFEWNDKRIKQVKLAVAAALVIGLGVLAFFVVRALKSEKAAGRWDEFARIQDRYEPTDLSQDPLFEGPGTTYRERRNKYLAELETFLTEVEGEDDALTARVHWHIAKVSADQVLSMKDVVDVEKRRAHWVRAKTHLETLRDNYPDFQTNWTTFAPTGHASLTRQFLSTVEANLDWESKHLPSPREPSPDVVVLVRTERGDMRIGLYAKEAPEATARFLEHALRGDYDGTAFFARHDEREGGSPQLVAIRGGHPATRDASAFDYEQHQGFAEDEDYDSITPESARYLIPMDRGTVVTWHPQASEYDGAQQFYVLDDRSPRLDHRNTPIGRLLDTASQDTAARIGIGGVWGSDLDVSATGDTKDFLQAPVKIVKVLVYENGTLKKGTETSETKVAPTEAEATLDGILPDAYSADAPERPAVPETPEGDEDEGVGDPEEPVPAEGQPDEPETPVEAD